MINSSASVKERRFDVGANTTIIIRELPLALNDLTVKLDDVRVLSVVEPLACMLGTNAVTVPWLQTSWMFRRYRP